VALSGLRHDWDHPRPAACHALIVIKAGLI
jgi:hypothetical protein